MRVVVAGGGNVGGFIAEQLADAGHAVDVIEIDPARVVIAESTSIGGSVRWVTADACEPSQLERVGVDAADVLVAATGDDEDNLVISLLAKQEFGVPRVIARVNNPGNEWMFNDSWGVDVSVSTPHLLTALVQEAVSVGSLVRLLSFERGKATLIETTLADDAPPLGQELSRAGFPRDSTVVAVIRHDHVIVPHGETVFQAGDEVLVLVTPESEPEVRALLTGRS